MSEVLRELLSEFFLICHLVEKWSLIKMVYKLNLSFDCNVIKRFTQRDGEQSTRQCLLMIQDGNSGLPFSNLKSLAEL